MPPQTSDPVQQNLAICPIYFIQSSVTAMTNKSKEDALSSCKSSRRISVFWRILWSLKLVEQFLQEQPQHAEKILIDQNDANIVRLMKISNGGKLYEGEISLAKAQLGRAELQNCYMPLLMRLFDLIQILELEKFGRNFPIVDVAGALQSSIF